MEYQNVTLSLPKEVLRRAKERHLAMLDAFDLATEGNIGWGRGELHER